MAFLAALTRHWQLKLLSLVFATALWAFAVSEDTGESAYTVPVNLTDLPPGTEVTAVTDDMVDVRLQGVRTLLARLSERDVRVAVSLRDARPGDVLARITAENIRVPRGIRVVRVTPSRVRATLERVVRVRLDVTPRLVGQPARGFQVGAVRVEPRQVDVKMSGPESAAVRRLDTAPVDVEGARATVSREVGLVAPAGIDLAEGRRVTVTVEVVAAR
jgi:YbbR domain-containing protein